MNIRKFVAASAREALREIRNELGEDAVILSNKTTLQGVEIVAMNSDDMVQLSSSAAQARHFQTDQPMAEKVVRIAENTGPADAQPLAEKAKPVAEKAKSMAQRMAQIVENSQPIIDKAIPMAEQVQLPASQATEASLLGEIKSMHSKLQKQIETLSWNNVQQRDPQRAALLRRMLNSGFSALLARQMLDKMPSGNEKGEFWIKQVLKRNLHVAGAEDDIVAKGGAYALIGPTGVGKTTTTAKLAARAVVRYGADKVALLTTDSYRIGAYEQLKIYGKILGVAVHAVKGADDLRLTLAALRHKHLVLIDTVGMGQKDERVAEQNDMFDEAGVARLLVLNATSSGDTLEDVVRMYCSDKVIGCIATKLDEAANLGAVLDVVVRHRLMMFFMANGQRVPEDLHPVNIDILLHRAFKPAEEKSPYTLEETDFPMIMADSGAVGEVSYAL